MVDVHVTDVRSKNMRAIKAKNTKPELFVRKGLHALGKRYRLHVKELPGKPDLVFPKYKAVVFIHGCFWHGHSCYLFKEPSSKKDFWNAKISGNRARDIKHVSSLSETGWRILTVWECAIKGRERIDANDLILAIVNWLESESLILDIDSNYRTYSQD